MEDKIKEISDKFDVLLNSYFLKGAFGDTANPYHFDEYEKSVFLTEAQETYVLSMYNGKNPFGDSFEKTEEMRRFYEPLVCTEVIKELVEDREGISDKSYFFKLPDNVWFITYEVAKISAKDSCMDGVSLPVIPSTQDDWHRLKKNPFRGTNTRRALRFDCGDQTVEIVSDYPVVSYKLRYLKRPEPIILIDLNNTDLTIQGKKDLHICELPLIEDHIIEAAVHLAISSRIPPNQGNNNNNNNNN